MQCSPGVTFIIAAKNCAATLGDAIESSLSQAYAGRIEVVVVDDNSDDDTAMVAAGFSDDICVIKSDRSLGRAAARNLALQRVRTPLMAVQDADDVSHPWRLAETVRLMPDFRTIVGGQTDWVDSTGSVWRNGGWPVEQEQISRLLDQGKMPIAHPTMLCSTELVRSVGGYSSIYPVAEDLDLVLRLRRLAQAAIVASPRVVLRYNRSPSDSFGYALAAEYWRRRVSRDNGLVPRINMVGLLSAVLNHQARGMVRFRTSRRSSSS